MSSAPSPRHDRAARPTAAGEQDGRALRDRLRALPALAGDLPPFDTGTLPEDPAELFVGWLDQAIAAGVAEPHVVTVSTAAADGTVSARVVVLKDVADGAWEIATDSRSRKVRDVAENPRAALTSYWPAQGRQVRLSGGVVVRDRTTCAADFLARRPASRAAALATRPGTDLSGPEELSRAFHDALGFVQDHPDHVLAEWTVLAVVPDVVEFFQGRSTREHLRVVYRRVADGWTHGLVWP